MDNGTFLQMSFFILALFYIVGGGDGGKSTFANIKLLLFEQHF